MSSSDARTIQTLARKERNDPSHAADPDTSSLKTAEGPAWPHPAVEQVKIWKLLLSSTCRPPPSISYSWFFNISFVVPSYKKILVWGSQISFLIH